jgi:hypothetical protein
MLNHLEATTRSLQLTPYNLDPAHEADTKAGSDSVEWAFRRLPQLPSIRTFG